MRMKNKERKPNNSKCSFEYTSDFCKRLKSVREERKISFAKIDAELHIPESTMKKYEYERVPNIETIIKLANFYGVDTDYLIGIQPYPSRDVKTLQDITGLSDKACACLLYLCKDNTHRIFEFLICKYNFWKLLFQLSDDEYIEAKILRNGAALEYSHIIALEKMIGEFQDIRLEEIDEESEKLLFEHKDQLEREIADHADRTDPEIDEFLDSEEFQKFAEEYIEYADRQEKRHRHMKGFL